jgi:carboxypeptidase Q
MLLSLLVLSADAKKPPRPPPAPPPLEEVAATLLGRALLSSEAYDELAVLCDDIGHRLSGSPQLERAVAWALERMREDGLVNVRAEPVQVPVWVRGEERARMLAPAERELEVMALGGSVGTPSGPVSGEVVVIGSFEELEARKAEVEGKIVLFDVPFTDYGTTVAYRGMGPARAAAHGAVAVLVRSVTPTSLSTLHTGSTNLAEGAVPVPAAAITLEAASQIRRLTERGQTVRLELQLGAHRLPDAPSANAIGEVRGREKPEEIVVLGCHLDSWDVGQGAQDDGAGCVAMMAAADLVRGLPVPPRRTLRVVLYTNEENGLAGGRAYADAHQGETHFAAVEADTGAGRPLGFRVAGDAEITEAGTAPLLQAMRPVAALLEPIGAQELVVGGGGADISPLTAQGVRSFGLSQDTSGYWPIHHTEADTFDKVDPQMLARNVAAVAVLAWALAELPSLP